MKHKEIRCTHFIGTAKEIAEQFLDDLNEAIFITTQYALPSNLRLVISRRLYRIIASYYGTELCLYADPDDFSTIHGIKVEKIFNDQDSDTMMFGLWALEGGKLRDYLNGTYMYKEKE